MLKWFEQKGEHDDIVISSRVRLARNLKKYPFGVRLTEQGANELFEEVKAGMEHYKDVSGNYFTCKLNELGEIDKLAMVERHILSPQIVNKKQCNGLILSEDESAGIMINEEDHLRIQTFTGGMNMKTAFSRANEIDDRIQEKFEIAFDEKYGYLTSCPTNVGTGLRASYMIFLPALSGAGKITKLASEVSKYGVTLRGLYGEGSKSQADIFQISNQKTLGTHESDIIQSLNNIVMQVIKQERLRREYVLNKNYNEIEDQVYRSYGVLKYTRQINTKDAMTLLSQVKFGADTGIISLEGDRSIYQMMMNIQPYGLQYGFGKNIGSVQRERLRAEYINKNLPELKSR
ncbi:protein arginine kinase [Anaeromicropila populeti]|uniref:Protein arginine kinase n=1 Tax=Anaeromicropila populeti TaxID=37658 RepID=A0A1I6IRY1_9FIRM|nr:protein arginine kinase [Anaeromicropila populeti]SFR69399.1 protein arginine kinase [Anaeromicropila populeti]